MRRTHTGAAYDVVGLVLASLVSLSGCWQEPEQEPAGDLTRGEYMGQKWYIDKNHILYWDGKPYIPGFVNDFTPGSIANIDPEETIEKIKGDIDAAIQKGITEFLLDVIYLPDTPAHAEESDEKVKQVSEYINAVGGTYYLMYSLDVPKAKLLAKKDPEEYQECLADFTAIEGRCTGFESVDDMLKPDMLEVLREDLRRLGSTTSPALRAFELFGESEDMGGGTVEEHIEKLETVFDVYGKIAKEEVGDVPVFMRGTGEGMRVALSGLRAENFDGIRMQISGPMPEFVRTAGGRYSTLILRALNSCSKTKLYWSYSQGRLSYAFFMYRSKELLRGHFQALIEAGVTGFPYDEGGQGGLGFVGGPDDTLELQQQNHQWWVELQPEFEAEILRRAENKEFSTGKWAVPMREEEWRPPTSTLDTEQVESIARNHPDVKRLLDLGASLWHVQFFPDYSAWVAQTTGPAGEGSMVWELWIDDPSGEVIINGIKLVEDMRQAGYPVPPDEVMLNFLECPLGDCETGDGESGCVCSDPESSVCTTDRIVNGCCVAGVCN